MTRRFLNVREVANEFGQPTNPYPTRTARSRAQKRTTR